MRLARFWFINARPHSLVQSLLPAFLAVGLAAGEASFSPLLALLAVAGVGLAHLSVNLFDDYFDYRHQNSIYRDLMAREGVRARIAKCPYLTSGQATLGQLLVACAVFGGLGLALGIPIFLAHGVSILWLAAGTAALGLAYSGWPLRLSYRGFGEIEIGAVFGPLLMSGVHFAAGGSFDPAILLIAVPVGFLVMNVVYVHAIMDVEPDKRVGKMTLAVLAGGPTARLAILALALFAPYALIAAGVAFGRLAPAYLLVLATAPLAVALFRLMLKFVREPGGEATRRFWMGPMSRWEIVKANGLEWFMTRWYLARNLLLFYCLAVLAARVMA
jgi:1,4-dihydroxy-2-naphthoate octaprenyltransferase